MAFPFLTKSRKFIPYAFQNKDDVALELDCQVFLRFAFSSFRENNWEDYRLGFPVKLWKFVFTIYMIE